MTSTIVTDPTAANPLDLLSLGRLGADDQRVAALYWEQFTNRRALVVRHASTGTQGTVNLPVDSLDGWYGAVLALRGDDVWVLGGGGPLVLRHYRLSGSPLPTSATLVSRRALGDSDSRVGDVVALADGRLAVVWHQHGSTGPQGMAVGFATTAGGWSQLTGLQFMPTRASKQSAAQHPADGTLWIFNNPDGWGRVGLARISVAGSTPSVLSTEGTFLDPAVHGDNAPDPENPDLVAVTDAATTTVALAYQSKVRLRFSTTILGSQPVVARFTANRSAQFVRLAEWVERVSNLGLAANAQGTWLTYRPVDAQTLRFDQLQLRRLDAAGWSAAAVLGTLADAHARIGSGGQRAEVVARMSDGTLRLFSAR